MSNIEIKGFSPLQQDIADRIWSLDTEDQIQEFVTGLPRNLKREAWVVMQMIIAAELDKEMEVEHAVKDYCHGL